VDLAVESDDVRLDLLGAGLHDSAAAVGARLQAHFYPESAAGEGGDEDGGGKDAAHGYTFVMVAETLVLP
jgi:hypothetical protein